MLNQGILQNAVSGKGLSQGLQKWFNEKSPQMKVLLEAKSGNSANFDSRILAGMPKFLLAVQFILCLMVTDRRVGSFEFS